MYALMCGHAHHGGLAAHMQVAGACECPGKLPHGGHPAAPHTASAALGPDGGYNLLLAVLLLLIIKIRVSRAESRVRSRDGHEC